LLIYSFLNANYQIAVISDNFVIHTTDGKFPVTQSFIEELNQRIDQLQMGTGVYLDARADIYVVPDAKSYALLTRGKGRIVEFSSAFYSSLDHRIYIRSPEQIYSNYNGIIMHEYTHWFLDEILRKAPLWFHEGMATQQGNQLGLDRYYYYIRERFWGNKMDLIKLAENYPQQPADWDLYYITSYYAVQYMKNKNPESWKDFWEIVADNYRIGKITIFSDAFYNAYHKDLWQFNEDFSVESKRQAYVYIFTGLGTFILILMPIILIFAHFKQRKKMKALPDLEYPDDSSEDEDDNLY